MTDVANAFDPWGPISAILFETGDSDFVQNAIATTGLDVSWHSLSKGEAYSHGTRIRALRQDIQASYAELAWEKRGLFAQIVVKALLRRRDAGSLRAILL